MQEKQSSTEEERVIGGKNVSFYALTCNNIPIGGFSFQTKSNLTESNENVNYTQYMEPTLNIRMEVRDNGTRIKNEPVPLGTALQISISCESKLLYTWYD
ncbi:hypothetical protein CHS0354_023174 [Potamilus streckersoni]|uniref:Uncharacterized protein n=1 Tax=Potamilus streckersoni TaxID=2493646 RepID=A0AAE0TC18_9BIVA|nr:hypothetical protein CHS0354_023174 [Potamilus streckersoni]